MPGMLVVGKALKNMPGDKSALVLKASLLAKEKMPRRLVPSPSLTLSGSPRFTHTCWVRYDELSWKSIFHDGSAS